jgi:hypothetical protein
MVRVFKTRSFTRFMSEKQIAAMMATGAWTEVDWP